jgi:hypothetical protein
MSEHESNAHKLVHDRSTGALVTRCACDTGHAVTRITLADSWPGTNIYHQARCSCGWRFEYTVADATYRVLADHIARSHNEAGASHHHEGDAR